MLLCFFIHFWRIRKQTYMKKSKVIGKYCSFFFTLTYLVLPAVTTKIFGAISCQSIDPEGIVPNTPKYLRRDLSISCSSSRYIFGRNWAIGMIFVYPIGVLGIYFFVLFVNRKAIMRIDKTDFSHEQQQLLNVELRDPMDRRKAIYQAPEDHLFETRHHFLMHITPKELNFLHFSYEPKFWYWEVIETSRRLILTAVLSVVATG